MKIAGFAALSLVSVTASAEPRFDEYAAGMAPAPATRLVMRSCAVGVEIRGGLALIEERLHIETTPQANAVPPVGAVYDGALPDSGVVTGFSVRIGKAMIAGVAISKLPQNQIAQLQEPIDPASLIHVEGGFRVVLQPMVPGTDATLIVKYAAPVEVRGGALTIALPARVGGADCQGTLRASAGPGASVAKLFVGTDAPSAGRTRTFTLSARGVRVGAELAFARDQPVVWTQPQKLTDGTATLVTVAAPLQKTANLGHRRVLFVVDGSRSMELVGPAVVREAVNKIVAALPANTPIEAILFDRKATRVLGSFTPATPAVLNAIEKQISLHVPTNGSDLAAAFRLAHQAIADGQRDATLVVVISDGVLGDIPGQELITALDATTSTVDVVAIAIDPAQTRAPDIAALHAPVSLLGGSMVEVESQRLDDALLTVSEWLRPAWHDVTMGAALEVPPVLRAGSGFVRSVIDTKAAQPALSLRAGETKLSVRARPAAAAPIAPVALRAALSKDAKHPYVDGTTWFAVLSPNTEKQTAARTALARAGGTYLRIVHLDDPYPMVETTAGPPVSSGPSAIDESTLTRLFREQLQPKAYVCYQRALGGNTKLAGTVRFTFVMGRGEVTRVDLLGLNNAALDACLLDAAYTLSVPFPDFAVNSDDQTIANYPLTLQVNERKPVVIAGDADSSSPIDIDAIEAGVAPAKRPVKVDARTPLGTMKPSK